MEITKQTNSNECGICAITSLVKHFYTYADKNQILNQANLTENGLSIFNFELLAQRFGLLVDTYQME
jgi:ABC-type bacteriocin/lantibiotic exporter with double-glycine peptidase domain